MGILQNTYASLPVFAQNSLVSAAGYMRYLERFGGHYDRVLREWEESIDWPLARHHANQSQRLSALIDWARHEVPYYRDLGPAATDEDPLAAIRQSLEKIPPLEKTTYRDQPEAFLARSLRRSRLVRGFTSGTTGSSLPLWCTRDALAEEYAAVWRLRRSCGVSGPRDPNLTFNGATTIPFDQTEPPFWRSSVYDSRILFSVYHMKPNHLPHYVEAVHRLPSRYIEGYPSAIHLVARAMLAEDRPLPEGRLAAVFTSSESLLTFQRESIEKAFNAPVRDRYGVSEKAVSMTECERGLLHVDMEFCIVEVQGSPEPDGTVTGPLLVTGLSNFATPMFRYRIGDVGTRSPLPCPCGRAGDAFLEVDGRVEDYVLTPDGRLVGRLDHIFKQQRDVAEAQILQATSAAIEILVVPREGFDANSMEVLRNAARLRVGSEMELHIRTVDEIPRERNGKFRAVKSLVARLDS